MSAELTLSLQLKYRKGATDLPPFGVSGLPIDVSGSRYVQNIQQIGTSEEAIGMGEITTPGYFICVNRDPTNTIHLRRATGQANAIVLGPGQWACFRMESAAAWCAIAITAACYLEYLVFEA